MTRQKNGFVYEACERLGVRLPDIDALSQPYYGQCAEDLIVVALLRALSERTGVELSSMRYLEVGANHPVSTSATYLAHVSLGMTGVLVEANEALIADLKKVRTQDIILNVAVSHKEAEHVDLHVSNQDEVSSLKRDFVKGRADDTVGISEVIKVPARRIDSIMEEYFPFDAPAFMSIDLEGLDYEILSDFSFVRWRPYIIQTEPSNHFEEGNYVQLAELLEKNDYTVLAHTDVNIIAVDRRRLRGISARSEVAEEVPAWLETSEVDAKIRQFDYLSIDIFDTLLFRHCKTPTEVFAFMANRPEVLAASASFEDFRIAAEQLAREEAEQQGAEDVSLEEIYECFRNLTNCTAEQAEVVKSIELQTEIDVLYPTTFGQNLINFARQNNKRFIITSDMYLPQDFLEKLLKSKGYSGYELLFVSNVQGRTKHTGTLFQDVIDHFRVSPDQILHIGDNKHADGEMAVAAGLASHVVLASKDLPSRSPKPRRQSHLLAGEQPISQVFIANYLETNHFDAESLDFRQMSEDDYFKAFGAVMLAPIITSFMIWMKRHLDQRNIDRVVFLARDGMFPKAAFELLWPSVYKTSYVAASRRLLTLPFTRLDPDTLHGMFDATLEGSSDLNEFFEKIAADPSVREIFHGTGLDPSSPLGRKERRKVLRVLMDNTQAFFDSFASERQTLTNYYRSVFPPNSKSAVFDVGWRGSLQRSIDEIVSEGAQISGMYFGTGWQATSILRRNGQDYESYTTENGLPRAKEPWVADFRDIVEFFCSANHGSVLKILEDDAGNFTWQTAEVGALERKNLDLAAKIQEGALSAIESVVRSISVDTLEKYVSRDDEVDLREFLKKPHRADAMRFKEVRVFAGVGDTTGESLTRIGERRSHYYNAKKSRWRAAYAASLRGLTRARVTFLLRKRKKIRL